MIINNFNLNIDRIIKHGFDYLIFFFLCEIIKNLNLKIIKINYKNVNQ